MHSSSIVTRTIDTASKMCDVCQWKTTRTPSFLERHDPREGSSRSPDAPAQAGKLDNLRMIDEEVGVGALVLNVIRENLRVGGFKHNLLFGKSRGHSGDDISPPTLHVLRDTLAFNHDHMSTGLQELLSPVHEPLRVTSSSGLQLFNASIPTSSPLDADLRLGLEAVLSNELNDVSPVVRRDREEAGRDLKDIEPNILALFDVLLYGVFVPRRSREHAFNVASCADIAAYSDSAPRKEVA